MHIAELESILLFVSDLDAAKRFRVELLGLRDLLDTTELPIEVIAEKSGFGSAPVLHHHFRECLDLNPNLYRYRFKRREK